ncbi:MAG: cation diffusion facilitator family transporter [Acidobacteriota bacterium]|nr:cation diffusion facilitator family transporter [Acidobacteriota bacterium]
MSQAAEQALIDSGKEKRAAARSSVIAAVFLTGMKIAVGLLTGSLGILAEAAHSALDLVAAAMTLVAVRVSSRPADSTHPYGHGKVENLSAMLETGLLLLTCIWIIYEAVRRLFFQDVHVEASVWAFVVMAVSIVIDLTRSRILKRAADKHHSQALEADALHFSTDVWSSSVVILGLALVGASKIFKLPWLAKADAIAALGVSAIVVYVSFQLGRKTITDLLDGVPATLREDVVRAAHVPGVLDVQRARIRRAGPEIFVDVVVYVSRHEAFEHTHEISNLAKAAIRRALKQPEADVIVHVAPSMEGDEDLVAQVRSLAARRHMDAHDILFHEENGSLAVDLHLEIRDAERVGDAHDLASRFEAELRDAVPRLARVVTHLEPVRPLTDPEAGANTREEERVRTIIAELAPRMGLLCDPHDIEITRGADGIRAAFHCTVDASTALEEAHRFSERFELALRHRLPRLGRVVIHIEPPEPVDPGRSDPAAH